MTTHRTLAVLLLGSLLPATLAASPTAVEFQGVTIGSKLKTTPVEFKTRVGLGGGGFLAPGSYDVEVASTGDKSRVMLLFFQKGRKMGETPGVLKLGPGSPGGYIPCIKPGAFIPCVKPGAIVPCVKPGDTTAHASGKRYLSFEQLGFAGGARAALSPGAGGGFLLTIPGARGNSIEAQLPAAH